MATSLLGSFLRPTFAIIDLTTRTPALRSVVIESVSLRFPSRLLANRGELGELIIDGRVLDPSTAVIRMFCSSRDALDEVNRLVRNTSSVFTIQSRGLEFPGYMVESNQQEQKSDYLSTSPVEVRFKRVMIPAAKMPICAQSGDAATVFGGIVNSYVDDGVNSLSKITNAISEGIF